MNQPTGSCYSGSIPLFDEQAILAAQANRAPGSSSADQGEVEPPEILDEDVEMNEFASNHSGDPSDLEPLQLGIGQLRPGRYVETFEGCGETFPGGRTFMDGFWADEYAEQRRENIYYPWASKDEWAFASWLLRSRLSMAAIDSLLSLDIVSNYFLLRRFSDRL